VEPFQNSGFTSAVFGFPPRIRSVLFSSPFGLNSDLGSRITQFHPGIGCISICGLWIWCAYKLGRTRKLHISLLLAEFLDSDLEVQMMN